MHFPKILTCLQTFFQFDPPLIMIQKKKPHNVTHTLTFASVSALLYCTHLKVCHEGVGCVNMDQLAMTHTGPRNTAATGSFGMKAMR